MNYKGIYFGETKSQKFCEFGVHFNILIYIDN